MANQLSQQVVNIVRAGKRLHKNSGLEPQHAKALEAAWLSTNFAQLVMEGSAKAAFSALEVQICALPLRASSTTDPASEGLDKGLIIMNTLGGGVAWRLLEHICIQTCPSTEPAGDGAEELAHGHIWQVVVKLLAGGNWWVDQYAAITPPAPDSGEPYASEVEDGPGSVSSSRAAADSCCSKAVSSHSECVTRSVSSSRDDSSGSGSSDCSGSNGDAPSILRSRPLRMLMIWRDAANQLLKALSALPVPRPTPALWSHRLAVLALLRGQARQIEAATGSYVDALFWTWLPIRDAHVHIADHWPQAEVRYQALMPLLEHSAAVLQRLLQQPTVADVSSSLDSPLQLLHIFDSIATAICDAPGEVAVALWARYKACIPTLMHWLLCIQAQRRQPGGLGQVTLSDGTLVDLGSVLLGIQELLIAVPIAHQQLRSAEGLRAAMACLEGAIQDSLPTAMTGGFCAMQAARTHVIAPLCLLSLATTGRRLPEAYSLPNGSCAAYIPCSTTNCLDGADMLLHNWQISLTKPPAAAVQLLMQLLRSCLRHEESGMHRCSVLISSLVYLLDIDAQYDWATVDSIADVMLSLLGASSASFEAAAANQVDLAELHGLVFATGLRFAPQTTVAYIGRLVRHEVAPQCTFDSSNACQSLITGLAKVEGGVDHRKLWLEILTPWITLHDEPRLQHEAHRIMAALSKGRRYNDISRILIKGAHERLVEGLRHQPQNTVADIGAAHLVLNWMAALWRHCTAGGEPAWRDLVKLDWPATTAAFAKFADGLRSSPDAAEKVSALQAGFDKLDRRLHIQSGRDAEAAAAALLADEAAEAAGKALQEVKTAAKAAAKRAKKQRAKQKGKALTPLAVAALDAAVEQATEMGGSSDAAAELVSEVAGSSDAAAELASKAASSNDAIVEPVTEEADARDAAGTTELQPRACAVSEAVHAAHASSSPPTAFMSNARDGGPGAQQAPCLLHGSTHVALAAAAGGMQSDGQQPASEQQSAHALVQPAIGSLEQWNLCQAGGSGAHAQQPAGGSGAHAQQPAGISGAHAQQPAGRSGAHAQQPAVLCSSSSPGMYGITEDAVSCPITQEVMQDPVVCADGHTYERIAIAAWLKVHDTSPMTNEPLEHKRLIPNVAVRQVVGLFLQQTRSD